MSKAFDHVWHKGLLLKLRLTGITGPLLTTYRTGNSVLSCREHSDWSVILSGVPQGSILGPLLFLIYINDIVKDIDTNVRLFTDDTSLYIIVVTPVNAAQKLNADLSKILLILPRQSKMIISRKRSIANHPSLVMTNQQI